MILGDAVSGARIVKIELYNLFVTSLSAKHILTKGQRLQFNVKETDKKQHSAILRA